MSLPHCCCHGSRQFGAWGINVSRGHCEEAGSGESSRKGSRQAEGRSQVATALQLHRGKGDLLPGPTRTAQAVQGPSGAVECRFGSRIAVIPVYRDMLQSPKGQSGGVLNLKQAGMAGSGANPASNLAQGLIPKKWRQLPKGKLGQSGRMRPWSSPRRGHIGASNLEDRGRRRKGRTAPVGEPEGCGGG